MEGGRGERGLGHQRTGHNRGLQQPAAAVAAPVVLFLRIILLPVHSPPGHPAPSHPPFAVRRSALGTCTSRCGRHVPSLHPVHRAARQQCGAQRRCPILSSSVPKPGRTIIHSCSFGVWRNLWRLEKQADGFFQAQPVPVSSSSLNGGCLTWPLVGV